MKISKRNRHYINSSSSHNRERLTEVLLTLREQLCNYMGNTCDCKFISDVEMFKKNGARGEQSCCPELAVVSSLLIRMTDKEFKEILSRDVILVEIDNES